MGSILLLDFGIILGYSILNMTYYNSYTTTAQLLGQGKEIFVIMET